MHSDTVLLYLYLVNVKGTLGQVRDTGFVHQAAMMNKSSVPFTLDKIAVGFEEYKCSLTVL